MSTLYAFLRAKHIFQYLHFEITYMLVAPTYNSFPSFWLRSQKALEEMVADDDCDKEEDDVEESQPITRTQACQVAKESLNIKHILQVT